MLKEIFEQPRAVRDTIAGAVKNGRVLLDELDLDDDDIEAIDSVYIIGCGTSYHAGLVARELIERWARIPVSVEVASEFRYRDPIVGSNTLVIAISQSGETADTLAAVRIARAKGAQVFAVTNCVGSRITRESDGVLYVRANMEISVAATKSFLAQIACLMLIAMFLGQKKGRLTTRQVNSLYYDLRETPSQIEDILQDTAEIEKAAKLIAKAHSVMYVGRGIGSTICYEGALKLKEISYLHAEAYPAGELKHGPIALLDETVPVVAVVTDSPTRMQTLSNVQEDPRAQVACRGRGDRRRRGGRAHRRLRAVRAALQGLVLRHHGERAAAAARTLCRPRTRLRRRPSAQPREVCDGGIVEREQPQPAEQPQADAPRTGLGVDIVEVARMEQIIVRSPAFTRRVFSEQERAYAEAHHRPAVHYAMFFAAKEAVLKALGTGFSRGIKVTDVEVVHEQSGRPNAVLHGRAKEVAAELGVQELPLSLSRTHDTAVANAIAVTKESRPRVEDKPTPRQELAARFKELRGMLDDLESQLPDALDDEPAPADDTATTAPAADTPSHAQGDADA